MVQWPQFMALILILILLKLSRWLIVTIQVRHFIGFINLIAASMQSALVGAFYKHFAYYGH